MQLHLRFCLRPKRRRRNVTARATPWVKIGAMTLALKARTNSEPRSDSALSALEMDGANRPGPTAQAIVLRAFGAADNLVSSACFMTSINADELRVFILISRLTVPFMHNLLQLVVTKLMWIAGLVIHRRNDHVENFTRACEMDFEVCAFS